MKPALLAVAVLPALAIAFVGTGVGTPGPGEDPRATATETDSTVTVHVQQLVPADAANVPCPAIARNDELCVRLIGQSLRDARIDLEGRPRVPRVVGLRGEDAVFALRAQGFRVSGQQSGTVAAQRPSPRTPAHPGRTTVTLTRSPSGLPPLRPIRFRTVAAGGIASSFSRRTSLLVRSERRWRTLWLQLNAGGELDRRPPRVDFSREMLLLVTQGRRPEGDDRVRITFIGDTGGSLEAYATEYASADECPATDVNQNPYHVVRLPRSPHRAHVVRFHEVAPCGPTRPPAER